MKKIPPEEKIFLGLIISQIILMLFAIKFMTGAARPPKQISGTCRNKDIPNYILEERCYMIIGHNDSFYYLSDEDLMLIGRCITKEAGGECDEGQQAVATVIFNRYFSPDFPNEFDEIIVPGQFAVSTSEEVTPWVMVNLQRAIIDYGTQCQTVPYNCYYFRADHYHDFGIPYQQIGNNYFSLSEEATD